MTAFSTSGVIPARSMPADAVQVAPGEIKLHQVDGVNLDVDLGDVAVVEADARLRGGLGRALACADDVDHPEAALRVFAGWTLGDDRSAQAGLTIDTSGTFKSLRV